MSTPAPNLQPVKSGSVKSRVVDAIREAIFSGQFQPGASLREAHLASSLGVSQASVREALLSLEHAGLVVRSPNRETIVTQLTARDLQERSALRILLEGLAAVQAADNLTDQSLNELQARLAAIHTSLDRDSYMDYVAADLEFHRAIWRLSGNHMLCKTLELITVPLFAFLSIRRSRTLHNLARSVKSHDPILAALQSRDHDAIREAIRSHIADSYSRLSENAGSGFLPVPPR